jgi:hypothetical protein
LAEESPGAFLPDLAASLYDLAVVLAQLNRGEEARSRREEADRLRAR